MTLVNGTGIYDGTATRFTYSVCGDPTGCPVADYFDLSHFTIDLGGLSACGGFTIEDSGSTAGYATNDPTCPLTGGPGAEIKWDFSVAAGECRTVTVALAGKVGTGPTLVGTKSATTCYVSTVLGPSCTDCAGTVTQ